MAFLAIAVALFAYGSREAVYTRPAAFFISLSVTAAATVGLAVTARSAGWLALSFALGALSAAIFAATQYSLFPTLLDYDPWGHELLARALADNGHLPSDWVQPGNVWPITDITPYLALPGMHALVATVMLLTGLSYKAAALLAVGGIALVIQMLIITAIGSRVISLRAGVIAAILVATADNVLDGTGKAIIPNVLGFALMIACLLPLFELMASRGVRWLIVLLVAAAGLVTIHSISYVLLTTIVFAAATMTIAFALGRGRVIPPAPYSVALLVLVIWLGYYAFVAQANFSRFVALVEHLLTIGFTESSYNERVSRTAFEVFGARIGMLVSFAIAGVGFVWLSIRRQNARDYLLVALFLLGVAVSGIAILNPNLQGLALRFWLFTELIGAIGIAVVLLLLLRAASGRPTVTLSASVLVIGMLSYLMFTSAIPNIDAPLVPTYSLRSGLTESELAGADFALTHLATPRVASDFYYSSRLVYMGEDQRDAVYLQELHDPVPPNGLLIAREEAWVDRYIVLGSRYSAEGTALSEKDVREAMTFHDAVDLRIWSSGGVTIYA